MTPIPAALLARFRPDLTGGGHHLALRQVTVADHALMAVLGFQIGMLTEKVRDLGLDRPPRYAAFPIPTVTNFS
jgi:hypothetical protein